MENSNKSTDVSFVIIEYHCLNNLPHCIEAIRTNCIDINFEIIISSNSCYNTIKKKNIRDRYKNLIWIFNSKNLGFASAMNKGIKRAYGDVIILQNSDSIIKNNKLSVAIDILKKYPKIGLIGPKIINKNNTIQDSCRNFLTPSRFFARLINRFFIHKDMRLATCINEKSNYVDWVIGAFLIIPKRTIANIGMLNENYFLYVEDMDYCLRIWKKGMSVFYYHELEITFEGDRKSATKIKYTFMHIKNYLLFLINNWFNLDSCSNKRIKSLDARPNVIEKKLIANIVEKELTGV